MKSEITAAVLIAGEIFPDVPTVPRRLAGSVNIKLHPILKL